MANNRAFLVNKETGRAVCVMKALGGWYPPPGIKAKLEWMETDIGDSEKPFELWYENTDDGRELCFSEDGGFCVRDKQKVAPRLKFKQYTNVLQYGGGGAG